MWSGAICPPDGGRGAVHHRLGGKRKTVISPDYSPPSSQAPFFSPYIYCQIVSTLKCRPLHNRRFLVMLHIILCLCGSRQIGPKTLGPQTVGAQFALNRLCWVHISGEVGWPMIMISSNHLFSQIIHVSQNPHSSSPSY